MMFDELDQEPEEQEATELPEPRQMSEWSGDSEIEQELLALVTGERPPHALIFSGPEGVGKSTMAFRLARFLLAGKAGNSAPADGGLFGDDLPADVPESLFVAPDDPMFRKVASGGHSDLLVVGKQWDEKKSRMKGSVAVEDVRRVTPFLRLTASTDEGWRVVIVDDADTMTGSAQNGILKILEEPPERTMIILVTHRPGAMLPTIRSRSRLVTFKPLTAEQMRGLLLKDNPSLSGQDVETLYAVSQGSIGNALKIQEEGGLETIAKLLALLESWPDWNWKEIHMMAETLGKNGQEDALRAFEEIMLWICQTILRCKAKGVSLPAPLDNPAVTKMMMHYNLEEWIKICENLTTHFATVHHANLDKRHGVMGCFMIFNDIKEAA